MADLINIRPTKDSATKVRIDTLFMIRCTLNSGDIVKDLQENSQIYIKTVRIKYFEIAK